MTDLIIPRRKFLYGTATIITSLFAGPAIVRASSLMDINTLQNRLVVGFINKKGYPSYVEQKGWGLSLLNAFDFISKENYDFWIKSCYYNEYALIRRAEINFDPYCDMTAEEKKHDLYKCLYQDGRQ